MASRQLKLHLQSQFIAEILVKMSVFLQAIIQEPRIFSLGYQYP